LSQQQQAGARGKYRRPTLLPASSSEEDEDGRAAGGGAGAAAGGGARGTADASSPNSTSRGAPSRALFAGPSRAVADIYDEEEEEDAGGHTDHSADLGSPADILDDNEDANSDDFAVLDADDDLPEEEDGEEDGEEDDATSTTVSAATDDDDDDDDDEVAIILPGAASRPGASSSSSAATTAVFIDLVDDDDDDEDDEDDAEEDAEDDGVVVDISRMKREQRGDRQPRAASSSSSSLSRKLHRGEDAYGDEGDAGAGAGGRGRPSVSSWTSSAALDAEFDAELSSNRPPSSSSFALAGAAASFSSAAAAAAPAAFDGFPDPLLPFFRPVQLLQRLALGNREPLYVDYAAQFKGSCAPIAREPIVPTLPGYPPLYRVTGKKGGSAAPADLRRQSEAREAAFQTRRRERVRGNRQTGQKKDKEKAGKAGKGKRKRGRSAGAAAAGDEDDTETGRRGDGHALAGGRTAFAVVDGNSGRGGTAAARPPAKAAAAKKPRTVAGMGEVIDLRFGGGGAAGAAARTAPAIAAMPMPKPRPAAAAAAPAAAAAAAAAAPPPRRSLLAGVGKLLGPGATAAAGEESRSAYVRATYASARVQVMAGGSSDLLDGAPSADAAGFAYDEEEGKGLLVGYARPNPAVGQNDPFRSLGGYEAVGAKVYAPGPV
jgi:hypothetical protein